MAGMNESLGHCIDTGHRDQYFLFAPIVVDGLSMTPTLHNGDRMIVSKFGTPDRFDIVVFHARSVKTISSA